MSVCSIFCHIILLFFSPKLIEIPLEATFTFHSSLYYCGLLSPRYKSNVSAIQCVLGTTFSFRNHVVSRNTRGWMIEIVFMCMLSRTLLHRPTHFSIQFFFLLLRRRRRSFAHSITRSLNRFSIFVFFSFYFDQLTCVNTMFRCFHRCLQI